MSSDGRDDEQNRRNSEETIQEEEYNRAKIEKHKKNTFPATTARNKVEDKALIEQLRTERLAIKQDQDKVKKKKQSLERIQSDSIRFPQFTVRRKSTSGNYSNIDSSRSSILDSDAYYPYRGVRRSITGDIAPGGSRRATEPLKAQLLEIIDGMSPDSKLMEHKKRYSGVKSLGLAIPKRTTDQKLQETVPIFLPTPGKMQTPSETPLSPDRPRDLEPVAGPSRYLKPEQDPIPVTKPRYQNEQPTTPQYQIATSVPTNQTTIILPSTSSQMRDGRTQEFLNEGWYQNAYYQNTNDDFSSIVDSSARQMNMPPYIENANNIKNLQQMGNSGPIICDRCRYGPELTAQHSHPCCPAMAQSMAEKGPPYQEAGRTTIQCDNVCPKRQSFIRTIYNSFKQQIGKASNTGRPAFDPTVTELYRINISEGSDYQGHPKRVIFDLINGDMYRPTMANIGTNTQMGIGYSPLVPQMGIVQPGGNNKLLFNPSPQQVIFTDQQGNCNTGAIVVNHPEGDQTVKSPSKIAALKQNLRRHQERIDVYYFDHGNASYYRTTDSPGTIYTELIAERTEHNTAQYWAELFGTIHIAFALFTAFFLQMYRFVLQSTVRPLVVGFVQLSSDYMIKPILALLFNAIIQPILIYLYNIATSFRDLCEPIADAIGFFLREISIPIRAFRLVEVRQSKSTRRAYTPQML